MKKFIPENSNWQKNQKQKLALLGLVVPTLITKTTGSLQNIWDLLKPMHSIGSQPTSSDVQNAAVFCYYTTQNHMKHTLFHRLLAKWLPPKKPQVCYGSELQQGAAKVHKLTFASFIRIAVRKGRENSWKNSRKSAFDYFISAKKSTCNQV